MKGDIMGLQQNAARPQFSVSLMCLDFLRIREDMEALNACTDWYHVDIMDGHFAPNITLSPDMVRTFARVATRPIDVHLMTTDPNKWIGAVADAGAACISVHAETINVGAFRTLRSIEQKGCKRGIVLNPLTPLSTIEHAMDAIDLLTIMTVDIGYAGQPFIDQMLRKIEAAREYRERHGLSFQIQIDGACGEATFGRLHAAGADIYVLGTAGLFCYGSDLQKGFGMTREAFARAAGVR